MDNIYNKEDTLDKFAELCLDSVLQKYRRFDSDTKSKRSREKYQARKLLRRRGKKGGRYGY